MRLLLLAALALHAATALAWTPPPNPDPHAILQEARADRVAKRYEDALARHVWFHANALALDPALSGVRVSFALADWRVLAGRYEPAMAALRAERDAAAARVRQGGFRTRDSFSDAAAINRELDDEASTYALFLDVEARDPAMAHSLYRWAEAALIEARDFARCGKYLDADRTLTSAIRMREDMGGRGAPAGADTENRRAMEQVRDGFFVRDAAKVVALLVLSGRGEEAQAVATRAASALDSPAMKEALQGALAGVVPAPYPSRAEIRAMRDAMP